MSADCRHLCAKWPQVLLCLRRDEVELELDVDLVADQELPEAER